MRSKDSATPVAAGYLSIEGRFKIDAMPQVTDERMRELNLRYKAAYTAYQSSVVAFNRVTTSGKRPSPQLLESDATALRELTDARAKLLAAMGERAAD